MSLPKSPPHILIYTDDVTAETLARLRPDGAALALFAAGQDFASLGPLSAHTWRQLRPGPEFTLCNTNGRNGIIDVAGKFIYRIFSYVMAVGFRFNKLYFSF